MTEPPRVLHFSAFILAMQSCVVSMSRLISPPTWTLLAIYHQVPGSINTNIATTSIIILVLYTTRKVYKRQALKAWNTTALTILSVVNLPLILLTADIGYKNTQMELDSNFLNHNVKFIQYISAMCVCRPTLLQVLL